MGRDPSGRMHASCWSDLAPMTGAVRLRLVERFLPGVAGELPGDGEQIPLKEVSQGVLHARAHTLTGHPVEVLLD